jgi:hypothetical protein
MNIFNLTDQQINEHIEKCNRVKEIAKDESIDIPWISGVLPEATFHKIRKIIIADAESIASEAHAELNRRRKKDDDWHNYSRHSEFYND